MGERQLLDMGARLVRYGAGYIAMFDRLLSEAERRDAETAVMMLAPAMEAEIAPGWRGSDG